MSDLFDKFVFDLQRFATGTYDQIASGALGWANEKLLEINGSPSAATFEYTAAGGNSIASIQKINLTAKGVYTLGTATADRIYTKAGTSALFIGGGDSANKYLFKNVSGSAYFVGSSDAPTAFDFGIGDAFQLGLGEDPYKGHADLLAKTENFTYNEGANKLSELVSSNINTDNIAEGDNKWLTRTGKNEFTFSGLQASDEDHIELTSSGDGYFGFASNTGSASVALSTETENISKVTLSEGAVARLGGTSAVVVAINGASVQTNATYFSYKYGSASSALYLYDPSDESSESGVPDNVVINYAGNATEIHGGALGDNPGFSGTFQIGENGTKFTVNDKDTFMFNVEKNVAKGVSGIGDGDNIKGAFFANGGFSLNGNAVNITNNGASSTTDYTFYGTSLAGLVGGDKVTAAGLSIFGTDEITGGAAFEINGTSMAVNGDDADGVTFTLNASNSLAAVDGLSSTAYLTGDFTNTGGISVNGTTVEVTGDSSIDVYGGENAITKIAGLSGTVDVVSASGVEQVGADGDGTFTFSFAQSGLSFAVAGNNGNDKKETWFTFTGGTSVTAISGVDAGEKVTGNFEAGITVNESGSAIKVTNDPDLIVTNLDGTALGISGLTNGAIVESAGGVTEITTDAIEGASASFTFKTSGESQAFTVANGSGDDNGVTFLLDENGAVNGISSFDFGDTITGAFGGQSFTFSGTSGTTSVEATLHITGVSGTFDVVHDDFEVRNLATGASIALAEGIGNVYSLSLAAGASYVITDYSGKSFTVKAGTADDNGVQFILDGTYGNILGVSSLEEGSTLEGALGGLSQGVNGAKFDIQGDSSFGVVGAAGGNSIGYFFNVGSESGVTINNAGGASQIITDLEADGGFYFKDNAPSGIFISTDGNVTFGLSAGSPAYVTSITGLSDGTARADHTLFENGGISVNGKTIDIVGDEGDLVVGGNSTATGVDVIESVGGASVIVNNAGGASWIWTDADGVFTFASASQVVTIAGDSNVSFVMDTAQVAEISGIESLDAGGSAEANSELFSGGFSVNKQSIDIQNDENTLRVFGQNGNDGISMIDKVGSASGTVEINAVGGASIVQTDLNGTFEFNNGAQSFIISGDSDASVQFIMDASQSAAVTGIDKFNVASGQSGYIEGELSGLKINQSALSIAVEGDEDNIFQYIIDENAQTILGGVGASSATDKVVITGTGGASIVRIIKSGIYQFGSQSFELNMDAEGTSGYVDFYVNSDLTVTKIDSFDKGDWVRGNFSESAVEFAGLDADNASASAVVKVLGDSSVVVEHDAFLLKEISDGATIKNADGIYEAWTDAITADGLSVVDAGNHQFTVTGGSQSVAFLLDGEGNINGISALAAEQTLVGSQSALESFTEGFNGLSVVVSGDPDGFGVVGSGSGAVGEGITSIINLTGGASVAMAGGASYAYTDSDGKFTFTNAPSGIAISGDSAVQFIFKDGQNVTEAAVGGISQFDGWLTADANFFNDFTVNGQSVIIKNDADDMSVLGISGVGIGAISKVGPSSATGTVEVINAGSASYITTDKVGGFSFATSGQIFGLGGDSEITFTLNSESAAVTEITGFDVASGQSAVVLGTLNDVSINGNSAINVEVNGVGGKSTMLYYSMATTGETFLGTSLTVEAGSVVSIINAGGASYFYTSNTGSFDFAGNSGAFSLAGDSGVVFELVAGEPAKAAGVSYFGMTDPPTNTMAGISATISGYLNEFTKGINNSGQSIAITGDKDSIFSYAVDDVGVGTGEHATLGMVAPEDNGLVEVNGLGGASVLEIVGGGSYEFFGDKTFTYASDSASETFSGDSVAQFVLNGETVTQINSFDQGDTVTGDFSDKIEFNSGSGIVQVTGDSDSSIVVTNAGDGFILYDLDDGATFGESAVVGVKEAWTDVMASGESIAVKDAVGNTFTVSGADEDGVQFIVNKETGAIEGVSSLDQGVTLAGALGALSSINGNMFDIKGDSSFVVVGSEGASGIGAIYGLGSASGVTINYAGGASLIYTNMESAFYFKQGGDSATVGITLGTDEGWEDTEPNKSAVFSLDPDEDSYAIGVSGLNFESNYVQADHSVFEDPDGEHVGFTVNGKSVVIEGDEDDLVVYALSAATDGVGIQVIANVGSTSEAGVTIVDMGGASFLITDKPGKLTFGENGTTFETGGDSYVAFMTEGGTSVTEIAGLDEAGWVESTALSSLEGINNVKFDIQNDVGAMRVYGKGASSLDDWDDLDGIWENEWGNGITKITKVGNADDVVTVNDAAGATTIETDVNGDFYFATKGQSFYVEDTVDSSVQFIMDGSQSAFVTGIEGLSEGKIIFNTATSALNVNTIQYPAQKMTFFGTTSSVTLTVDPYQVVEVNGIMAGGYVSGVVGNGKDATVWAEGPVSVNGTAIDIIDSDSDYGILVSSESSAEEGTPYGAFGVTGDATVKVADFTVTADGDGEFLVGGESYTFEDGDQVFGFQTGSASEMTAVTSLDGSLVDYDGDVDLTFNGDDVAITGNEGEPVTLGGDSYHLTSVDGLQDGASIEGDLENASIVMAADTVVGDTVPVTLTVNDNVYKLYDDDDGVTIVGADKDGYGKIMGLADGASMQVALGGVYTVNQTDGSDATTVFSGSDTVPAGGIIIGTENGNSAYLYDPNNVLIRKKTPLEEIERITGIPTEGYSSIGGPSDLTKAHTPTDDGPLNISESDVIQGFQSASSADTLYPYVTRRDEYNDTLDLDQPLEIWIDNKESPVETNQNLDLSDNRYAKKVHMFEGTQSVEFNNDGGNLAHVESVASGKKNITLGDGGDVVVMDEPDAIQNAVSIIGGAGADSIFVREGANTTFDASEGGADKIITYAGAGARVTVVGYQASTAAGIKVDELPVENIFEAIAGTPTANPYISFGDGVVSITHPSYDKHSEVSIGSNDGASFVNIYNHKNTVQSVGFTGPDGGTLDVQNETDPLILVGNYKGEKENGSVILGGSGPDSILAGGQDSVDAKGGNNLVRLEDKAEREGAVIALTQGRTTIENMNNTLAASTGDTIVLSANNIKNFNFDGTNVTIDGNGFYGILEDVTAETGVDGSKYVTQYIYNSDNSTVYKAAGAEAGGTIDLPVDEDVRPNAFFGMNSGINFSKYADPQTVMIDLKGDMAESSIGGSPIYTKGITGLYGWHYDDYYKPVATTENLIFKGSDANDMLIAGNGNTSLYGDGGKNLLVGSYDYDETLSDKEGHVTFFVIGNANGAANTISNFEYVSDDNYKDTSRVTADEIEILEEQSEVVYADMSGDDVYIEVASFGGENKESVVLKDAIDSDGYGKDFIVSGNVAQVGHDKVKVDRFAEFYMATEKNATINVKEEGSPITVWLDNPETGKTFRGDFAVIDATGTTSNAQLAGLGSKENTIIAGDGNTSLWGGEGSSNDMLIGGAGKDNFYYGLGNGQDIISNAGDGDTVVLGLSIDDLIENECSVTDTTVYLKLKDGGDLTVIGSGTVDFKINNSEGVQETYYRDSNGSFKQR